MTNEDGCTAPEGMLPAMARPAADGFVEEVQACGRTSRTTRGDDIAG
jgi:hypothetical protein